MEELQITFLLQSKWWISSSLRVLSESKCSTPTRQCSELCPDPESKSPWIYPTNFSSPPLKARLLHAHGLKETSPLITRPLKSKPLPWATKYSRTRTTRPTTSCQP
uniref:Glucan endo-1 3-beta-glucosidase 12 n=1 Tax=Rhizophora mucronata TaxID=61149 RepID=A0A2P2JQU1_RHIMU